MMKLHELTITELMERFNRLEKQYRFTLGRVKYFYNREEFDRIPWEKLNVLDDAMNAVIIVVTMKEDASKRKENALNRMVEKYNALDERRAKFF